MAQIEFVAIASIMFTCFLTGVYSNSTDDSNLLLFKYKCTQGDYYDLVYGGCLRCKICKRENFKTASPCTLHSDAVCGDCEDEHEMQQQGESITCIRIQSSDKNDDIDIAHPGGNNDVALDSTPSRPSHSTTVNVTQTSPERKPINDASKSHDVNASIPSSDISFMEHKGLIAMIALITAAILVVLIVKQFRSGNTPQTTISANTCSNFTAVTINENNCLIKEKCEKPRRGHKNRDSSRRCGRSSSTGTDHEPDESLLDNVSSNSVPSVSGYHTQTAPSPDPSNRHQGDVNNTVPKQPLDMDISLNQSRQ